MAEHETLVDVDTLRAALSRPDWLVVDCRFDLGDPHAGRNAWHSAHIPGAVYAHLDEDLAAPRGPGTGRHPLPEPEDFARFATAAGIGAETRVICYDHGPGAIAGRLWWLLRYFGHYRVAVLDGGYAAWTRARLPVDARAAKRAPGRFRARATGAGAMDVTRLQAELAHGDCLLLDARSEERFRGDREPIDPVAGHVPGARNRPFTRNLDHGGCFLPPERLRAEFDALLGDRMPGEVVHMCGSGVTACHNLLAMEHAGLEGSRLYAGSWSGWVTDPDRPVATGP